MQIPDVFLYSRFPALLKARLGRASRANADGNRENPFRRPLMRRIVTYFIPVLGLIGMCVHFGCQEPTLVTTRGLPSPGPVNGMLYYLSIEKDYDKRRV